MSTAYHDTPAQIIYRPFQWTPQRSEAAVVLATGGTREEAAEAAHCDRSTIFVWLKHPDFCAEIDRLSLMVSISSRAERLRHAMRVIKSRLNDEGVLQSDKDSLDWLKFAQSETDGAKIDLSKLAELLAGESGDADTGNGSQPARLPPAIEVDAVESGSELSSMDQPTISSEERAYNDGESFTITTHHSR